MKGIQVYNNTITYFYGDEKMSHPNPAEEVYYTHPDHTRDCENLDCDGETCQSCCDHEYDPDEGFMCINCDAEYPW